ETVRASRWELTREQTAAIIGLKYTVRQQYIFSSLIKIVLGLLSWLHRMCSKRSQVSISASFCPSPLELIQFHADGKLFSLNGHVQGNIKCWNGVESLGPKHELRHKHTVQYMKKEGDITS
ncbi:zinc finger protein, partial [Clarias magur]